ncbi:MAG: HAD family hydrolase [Planctomycetota bacterium]
MTRASQPDIPYDLLVLDLDGTLLRPDGEVSDASVAAVQRARRAGLTIAVGTGRGLAESQRAIQRIGQREPVIVAGGSIIADPVSGKTLHRFAMREELARDLAEGVVAAGLPAIVLKDADAAGFDYLVVTGERGLDVDPVTAWWFDHMGVRVRRVRSIGQDEHPEHTLRVGVCGSASVVADAAFQMGRIAEGRGRLHQFTALTPTFADTPNPDPSRTAPPPVDEPFDLVEVFDTAADKWDAALWLSGRAGTDPTRIAAIGDEINDLQLIRRARLGIAMGNAVSAITEVADRRTRANTDEGVAHAIDRILAGDW